MQPDEIHDDAQAESVLDMNVTHFATQKTVIIQNFSVGFFLQIFHVKKIFYCLILIFCMVKNVKLQEHTANVQEKH